MSMVPALDLLKYGVWPSAKVGRVGKIMLTGGIMAVVLTFSFTMGYSRLVVSVHSWN